MAEKLRRLPADTIDDECRPVRLRPAIDVRMVDPPREDRLSPARGFMAGMALGLVAWMLLIFLAWHYFRHPA